MKKIFLVGLFVLFAIVAKPQVVAFLDTGLFVPLTSFIDDADNEPVCFDDLYDASYLFYGNLCVENHNEDTIFIFPNQFQYNFSFSEQSIFIHRGNNREVLSIKGSVDDSANSNSIVLPPKNKDTLAIFLYGGYTDCFISLVLLDSNFIMAYNNVLTNQNKYKEFVSSGLQSYGFYFHLLKNLKYYKKLIKKRSCSQWNKPDENFNNFCELLLREHVCYEKLIGEKCILKMFEQNGNAIEVNVKNIIIVASSCKRLHYIELLRNYIETNRVFF